MTLTRVVVDIVVVEAVLAALLAAAIVAHTLVLRGAAARRRDRLGSGRGVLFDGVARRALDDAELAMLRSFPRATLLRLFAELAPSLAGAEREWLGDLAVRCGLVDEAERRARSRWWWRRLDGSRLLMLFARGRDTQLRLARDPHALVRAQAAEALDGYASDAGVEALIGLLTDADAFCRFKARDALTRLGPGALDAVLRHLRDPHERALEALLAIAAAAPRYELAAAALAYLDDPRPAIRRRVAELLRALGGADASTALVQMLHDTDARVRACAAEGLALLGYWPAAPELAALLGDAVWDVRLTAALCLQRLGAPGELLLRRAVRSGHDAAPIARRVLDAAEHLRVGAPA